MSRSSKRGSRDPLLERTTGSPRACQGRRTRPPAEGRPQARATRDLDRNPREGRAPTAAPPRHVTPLTGRARACADGTGGCGVGGGGGGRGQLTDSSRWPAPQKDPALGPEQWPPSRARRRPLAPRLPGRLAGPRRGERGPCQGPRGEGVPGSPGGEGALRGATAGAPRDRRVRDRGVGSRASGVSAGNGKAGQEPTVSGAVRYLWGGVGQGVPAPRWLTVSPGGLGMEPVPPPPPPPRPASTPGRACWGGVRGTGMGKTFAKLRCVLDFKFAVPLLLGWQLGAAWGPRRKGSACAFPGPPPPQAQEAGGASQRGQHYPHSVTGCLEQLVQGGLHQRPGSWKGQDAVFLELGASCPLVGSGFPWVVR